MRKYSNCSNAASSVTDILPPDIANLSNWWDSDSVLQAGGKASQLTDKTGGINHAVQSGEGNKPTIIANSLNGHNAILFNGVDQWVTTPVLNISQPFVCYLVADLLSVPSAGGDIAGGFFGSPNVPVVTPMYVSGNPRQFSAFASALSYFTENPAVAGLSAFISEINGVSSNWFRNGFNSSGSVGTANISTALEIGRFAGELGNYYLNFKFYELLIYTGTHNAATRELILKYLENKYKTPFTIHYDGIFDNSVEYADKTTYKIRSAHSEYKFNYSGTKIGIKAISTLGTNYPAFSYISIFVNGVYNQRIQFLAADTTYKEITLPSGYKEISLVEPLTSRINDAGDVFGVFITGILALPSCSKIAITDVADKIVFIGDSITVGGNASNPSSNSFAPLFRIENSKQVTVIGWGYAGMDSFGSSAGLITSTLSWITEAFSNVTGTKKICIALGTNDLAVRGVTANNFESYYTALLDAIHVEDEDIQIWCLSPLKRGDAYENITLDDYRARISVLCSARSSYCTYIEGKTALAYPGSDFDDAVHPSTTGHKKLKDALYEIMYP